MVHVLRRYTVGVRLNSRPVKIGMHVYIADMYLHGLHRPWIVNRYSHKKAKFIEQWLCKVCVFTDPCFTTLHTHVNPMAGHAD